MNKKYIKVEDLAINGRELDLGAEKAAHDSPEEIWVNKDEEEYFNDDDDDDHRRIWAKLDLDHWKIQIFKNHFVCKLQLPKNIARRDFTHDVSLFALFLRKFAKFIYKHEVLNQQCKEGADIALEEAWDSYFDS